MKKIHFKEIDSTNTYLKNNYRLYDDFTFVSSDFQTSGRGRTGRVWSSDVNKNLIFSFLIKNEELIKKFKSISVISAYSVLQVLMEYGIDNISIKWPNDVYVDGEKICGILLEGITTDRFECLIVGIGLNVNQKVFEGEYLRKPTSMSLYLNKDVDIDELKDKLFARLESNLNLLKEKDAFYSRIKNFDYLKNKDVYALIDDEKKSIHVIGINDDYSLCIEHDGIRKNIESGEISFHI